MQETNWHQIYSSFSPKLLGICRRYIKDLATAEDIVQDAFIIAIQKEKDLKNKDALNSWMSRIVINRAINYLKKENLFNFSDSQNIELTVELIEMNTLNLDNKSAILASNFSHDDLLEAIDSLSENHKSVFNLYIIDGFSHNEISKMLSISVGTSKSSLSRARKNIQHFLINKLNIKKTDEKKKRIIAFLFLVGFGNQLFANYYKNQFSSFKINPITDLNTDKKVNDNENYILANPNHISKYLKFGVLLIVASLLLYFLLKENDIPTSTLIEPPANKAIIAADSVITKDSIPKDKLPKKDVQKIGAISIKNNKPISETTLESPKNNPKKDTITEPEKPKVVVIKKQIIKKDTVYVEKE